MFTQKEKDWILESINHLKRRKARPDFSRISLRMRRKHQLSISQTRQLLDSLVEKGIVVKAVYKNNTSYRDVSKWKKGKLGGHILNSSRMLERFVKAITDSQSTKDDKCTGVSIQDIEDCLGRESEDKCFLKGDALRDAIENEVSNGFLIKTEINFVPFYSVKVNPNSNNDNDNDGSDLDNLGRTGSENENSDADVSRNSSGMCVGNLGISNLNALRIAISETEEEEGNGSLFSDIESWINENQMTKLSPLKDNETLLQEFLNEQVKVCNLFELWYNKQVRYSVNKEAIKKQSQSDKSSQDKVHIQADKTASVSLRPPSKRKRFIKNHGPDFEMELPTKSKAKVVTTESKEHSFPTPLDSPVSEKSEMTMEQNLNEEKKKKGRPSKKLKKSSKEVVSQDLIEAFDDASKSGERSEQSSIQGEKSEQSSIYQEEEEERDCTRPDVSTWTAQQVSDYFHNLGYQEEAKQMLENDIDGSALYLLRRSDIVGPPVGGVLKIKKLGVALKLFRDVRNLLYQGNADNYVDPYEEKAFYRS